jgi:hypothetical protein
MKTKRLGIATGCLLLALPVLAWLAGTVLSWPARAAMPAPPAGAKAVSFDSASGANISGWLFPGQPGQGVVLLLHGISLGGASITLADPPLPLNALILEMIYLRVLKFFAETLR